MLLDRRTLLLGSAALALVGFAGCASAAEPMAFQMWHSPGCTCCLEWAKRMEAVFGRKLKVIEAPDIAAVKAVRGVPEDLRSCHTALVGNVVVEGHVPPEDIRRLIDSGESGLGLTVPGMPAGAPGMDVGHDHKEPFTVWAFRSNGDRKPFAQHGG